MAKGKNKYKGRGKKGKGKNEGEGEVESPTLPSVEELVAYINGPEAKRVSNIDQSGDGPERSSRNGPEVDAAEQMQQLKLSPISFDEALCSTPQSRKSDVISTIKMDDTAPRGLRVIATTDLPAGMLVTHETPLLSVNKDPNRVLSEDVEPSYRALSSKDKLDYDWLFPSTNSRSNNPYHTIFLFNRFRTSNNSAAVFFCGALYSHSCQPNAQVAYNHITGHLTVHTLKAVQKDEELTISYGDGEPLAFKTLEQRRKVLKKFRVECSCVLCEAEKDESKPHMRQKQQVAEMFQGVQEFFRSDPGSLPCSEWRDKLMDTLYLVEMTDQHNIRGLPEILLWTNAAIFALAIQMPFTCFRYLHVVERMCEDFLGVDHPLSRVCRWNLKQARSWSETGPPLGVTRMENDHWDGGMYYMIRQAHLEDEVEKWNDLFESIGWRPNEADNGDPE